jgi:hypothetical protein
MDNEVSGRARTGAEQPEAREMNDAETKKKDNDILDARMEYGHLMTNYMSMVNMFWLGYGAFFTINSLLATALGISYAQSAQSIIPTFLLLIHILIPATGIFISMCAIYASWMIVKMQRLINERGRELESTLLSAKIFRASQRYSERSPAATICGSIFFALMWAAAFFAVRQ